jgi:hypothetical protein
MGGGFTVLQQGRKGLSMNRFYRLGLAAVALAGAVAPAHAAGVTLVSNKCVSVSDVHGCLFQGNIAPNTVADTETAYNAARDPDITLKYLFKSDDGNFGDFGTVTGSTSGTWSTPNFLVDYIGVKAANFFVLYSVGGVSSGSWNTFDIPFKKNPHDLSHIAFFGTNVPEPGTWAMMIAGFGLVGAAVRRRRGTVAAATA